MASVSNNGRITFGIQNVNGQAYKLQVIDSPRGTWITRLTLPTIRSFVVATMNKYGRQAAEIAQDPNHSPYLTGALVDSIMWETAQRRGFTGLTIGKLTVGVPYGRKQELSPTQRKRLYLQRALQQVFPHFFAEVSSKGVFEDLLLGKRAQLGGIRPTNFDG